jgi:hypothetical protein
VVVVQVISRAMSLDPSKKNEARVIVEMRKLEREASAYSIMHVSAASVEPCTPKTWCGIH